MTFTKAEIKENLTILKEAYKRAVESGGVVSYSINSGQGTTSVTQASLSQIRAEIEHFNQLLQEITMFEDGSHIAAIRGAGLL